ncbi:MAG: tyrosine-type recombinase/integrase [Clostridia bacterium]|nr:tyrosine-type recombinase/integrase [Clostridia bacterium]
MAKTKTEAKKLYVAVRHQLKISPLNTKNKKLKGYWYTHIYVDGKRKVVQKATEDELYDFLYDFYREQESLPKTYEDVFNAFVEYKREHGRSKSTLKEYQRINGFLKKSIRNKAIVLISEDELRKWLINDFLKRNPKKEALKKMLQLLKAVFSFGIRKKVCLTNPAQDLLVEDYLKFCNLTTRTNEERSFSEEEIEKLRSYGLQDRLNPHAAVMLVAMETGMRAGELPAIRKDDIKDGYIYVHRQQIRDPKTSTNSKISFREVEYTKNERANPRGGRKIPITRACQEALNIALNLPGESEYLFHHSDGAPVLKDSYEYYLRRRCKSLGIKTRNNHAFRVAFNARLIKAGVDANQRCYVLGHGMQTNEKHYSFGDERTVEQVKNRLVEIT